MNGAEMSDWSAALVSAANELATSSFGYDEGSVGETAATVPRPSVCSLVALTSEEQSLQVGLVASESDSMVLCRALLCMEPEDEELEEQDFVDAFGEIANVLAGSVKTKVNGASVMSLGLPMVVRGSVETPSGTTVVSTPIRWGDVSADLVLLHWRKPTTSRASVRRPL